MNDLGAKFKILSEENLLNKYGYAGCLSYNKIKDIISKAPISPITGINGDITLGDAYCSQIKYVNVLNSISNLKRLKFHCKLEIANVLNISEHEKFDLIILDAPCSSVGTIRRHPEIFFRKIERISVEILLFNFLLIGC